MKAELDNMDNRNIKKSICESVVKKSRIIMVFWLIVSVISLFLIVDVKTGKPLVELDASVDSILPAHSQDRVYYSFSETEKR